MLTAATQYKYVAEAVWLPTYVGVGALVVGNIDNSAIAAAVMVVALIACRMVLELAYRIAFGDARLQWRVAVVAFGAQLAVWGILWAWYAQRGTARHLTARC